MGLITLILQNKPTMRISYRYDNMGNITVTILGAQGYGSNLAKKGTSTDITLYNLKKGEDTVTFIEPTRYPERLEQT